MSTVDPFAAASGGARLAWLDEARGCAIVAMVLYHFVFDLELFGLIAPTTATTPPWSWLATATAGSFLFLAGISLGLAHATRVKWAKALRRLLKIAGAALIITVATYFSDPDTFIFFGILHAIATFSLLGLVLLQLRLPPWGFLGLAGILFVGADLAWFPSFDHPALVWTGLFTTPPLTLDFEPLFPWAAPFALGIAAAAYLRGPLLQAGPLVGGALGRILARSGRHSLVIYLIHQPVLIAGLWLSLWVLG